MKIVCWNVNGLRAVHRKNALEWFFEEKPDILCLQETKADKESIPEKLKEVKGYHTYFSSAKKKGYSGVALYSKTEPKKVEYGFDGEDDEGRIIIAHYEKFVLMNIYFPNGKASEKRLKFKMDFYDRFLEYADKLKKSGHKLVICGDLNTAHTEKDIARPDENSDKSGFLPEERAWIDKFLERGYVDTFRMFENGGEHYTWWSYRTNARERNVGWRLDYFFVSENLKEKVKESKIRKKIMGSDHCPIELVLSF